MKFTIVTRCENFRRLCPTKGSIGDTESVSSNFRNAEYLFGIKSTESSVFEEVW